MWQMVRDSHPLPSMGGPPPPEKHALTARARCSENCWDQNFGKRMEAFGAMLRSSLAELELMMPEPELAGAYQAGDEYQFYRDLRTIVGLRRRICSCIWVRSSDR